MAGPEENDWVARLNRQLEPLQRALPPLAHNIEQIANLFATARDKGEWRRFFEQCQQISRALVAAHDRVGSPDFQIRLQLTRWMMQKFLAAKNNPSHRRARVWLKMGDLTPKQMVELLPYMMMDMPDLNIPQRKGRRRGTPASTLVMVERLDERIRRTGELPTTAARGLLTDLGFRGRDLKNQADHLVKVWRKRGLKSR